VKVILKAYLLWCQLELTICQNMNGKTDEAIPITSQFSVHSIAIKVTFAHNLLIKYTFLKLILWRMVQQEIYLSIKYWVYK